MLILNALLLFSVVSCNALLSQHVPFFSSFFSCYREIIHSLSSIACSRLLRKYLVHFYLFSPAMDCYVCMSRIVSSCSPEIDCCVSISRTLSFLIQWTVMSVRRTFFVFSCDRLSRQNLTHYQFSPLGDCSVGN